MGDCDTLARLGPFPDSVESPGAGRDAAARRDARGRFVPGNAGGPGNPHAAAVARMRAALLAAVTEQDIREVVRSLVEQAKGGNVQAARELLDRCCGRSEVIVSETPETEQRMLRIVLE